MPKLRESFLIERLPDKHKTLQDIEVSQKTRKLKSCAQRISISKPRQCTWQNKYLS